MGANVLGHPFIRVAERKKRRDIRTASKQTRRMTKIDPFEELLYPGPNKPKGAKKRGGGKKKATKPRRKRR